MEFFRLLPEQDGYSHKPSSTVVSRTAVEGGFDVRRAELVDGTTRFTLQYTVTPEQLEYVNDFVDAYFAAPTWFHMILMGFPKFAVYPLQRYAVQIEPGSYRVSDVDGLSYLVSFTVEGYLDDNALTSRLFPVLTQEGLSVSSSPTEGVQRPGITEEYLAVDMEWITGELKAVFSGTYHIPPEGLQSTFEYSSGLLRSVLLPPYVRDPEGLATTPIVWQSGTIKVVLITYTSAAAEGMAVNMQWTSGTLS